MHKAWTRPLFLVFSTLTLFACGGSHSSTGTGGTGGAGNGGTGGAGNGSTTGTGNGSGTGGTGNGSTTGTGGGTEPLQGGSIIVEQATFGAMTVYSVTAGFFAPHTGISCTRMVEGACQLDTCTASNPGTEPQAGTITVTSPDATATIMPGANSLYAPVNGMTAFWNNAGETITAQAAGGDIPAFMLSVPAPGKVTLTAPTFQSPTTPLLVDTAQDLMVTWTGTSPGKVSVTLDAAATATVSVACFFDASAGQGAVPSSLLGQLQKGKGGFTAYMSSTALANPGAYAVELVAITANIATGQITLQ